MGDDANEMAAMLAAVEMGEDPYNVSGAPKAKKKKKKKERKPDEGNYIKLNSLCRFAREKRGGILYLRQSKYNKVIGCAFFLLFLHEGTIV